MAGRLPLSPSIERINTAGEERDPTEIHQTQREHVIPEIPRRHDEMRSNLSRRLAV